MQSIYNLGLPMGFDEERLWLHIGRTERLSRLSGIGQLSVLGFKGDITEARVGVGGINSDGSGTATKTASVAKTRIVSTETSQGAIDSRLYKPYDWADGVVKVNNAEVEERIKGDGDKWEQGLVDPFARAHYVDRALRLGITAIGRDQVFQGDAPGTLLGSALRKSMWVSWFMMIGGRSFLGAVIFDSTLDVLIQGMNHAYMKMSNKDENGRNILPPRKLSLMNHKPYDRLVLAHGYAASKRLVAAT